MERQRTGFTNELKVLFYNLKEQYDKPTLANIIRIEKINT